MKTIRIHNATEISAEGTRTKGNCKPVFCITTGIVYTSAADAAEKVGCSPSNMSWALTKRMSTCKGMRFCYIANITEYLGEISETARSRAEKISAYDAIIASQNAERNARKEFATRQKNCEVLRARLEKEMRLMSEAQAIIDSFEN